MGDKPHCPDDAYRQDQSFLGTHCEPINKDNNCLAITHKRRLVDAFNSYYVTGQAICARAAPSITPAEHQS